MYWVFIESFSDLKILMDMSCFRRQAVFLHDRKESVEVFFIHDIVQYVHQLLFHDG